MGSLEEKLNRVSERVRSRQIPVTEAAPVYEPHPCLEVKSEQVARYENALLWQVVDVYEQALKFHAGCPVVDQALERAAAARKEARRRSRMS